MRIFVTGTRGIPQIPGGVESHCEKLYPIIAAMGHEVIVARRSTYVQDKLTSWSGVQLIDIFTPKKKSIEAITHTFLAILKAKKYKPDIVHIHAIGPSIMVPFARLLGLKVVITNHGPDYDRQKWNWLAKQILKLGEYLGGKFANEIIVISNVIASIMRDRCGRESYLIYNGVVIPEIAPSADYIDSLGLQSKNYILAAARFVPEKGLHDLINAFKQTGLDCKLVLAGDADHEDKYSTDLKKLAESDKRIVLTGFITGDKLHQIFHHAKLFVLPSYHEGLPIALLEALSYELAVLVSDIPANLEVPLRKDRYFECGNVNLLAKKLTSLFGANIDTAEKEDIRLMLQNHYNWTQIASETVGVYEKAIQAIKNKRFRFRQNNLSKNRGKK